MTFLLQDSRNNGFVAILRKEARVHDFHANLNIDNYYE